ncbi:hypothetical protein [Halorubrum sp. AS12]|uniref:hypothetical protein n=1 Tax=Halorubrum sp. AS12 TaxID=3409687 RepID=UPI003DA74F36
MVNRTRREMLSLVAAGSLALSGCVTSESPPPGVAVEDIEFENYSPESRTFEYQVNRGDEVVVDSSVTVEPEPVDGDNEGYWATEVVEHESLHDRAVYTFRVRLAGDDEWRLEFTFDGEDYTCLSLQASVNTRGGMAVSSGEVPASRCEALTSKPE